MRAAFFLIAGFALAACERRTPPAPADPAPPPAPAVVPTAPAPAQEAAPRPEQLRVVLGTEASLTPPATRADVVRRPWVGPLVEVLAEDRQDASLDAPTPLDKNRVERSSSALDGLFARGLDNLRRASTQPLRERTIAAAKSRVQITQFADNYTAARLLLPELWSKVAAESGGHLYAAAPVRDMIVWTTSAAKADQLALRAHARARAPEPFLPDLDGDPALDGARLDPHRRKPRRAVMATAGKRQRAALGFSVHTGWAILVAVSGPAASAAVIDRRRIEMMPHRDAKRPRFVYHAAQKLPRAAAERLVRESTEMSWKNAAAAIRAAVEALRTTGYDVVANGIIVGNKRLEAALDTILQSHALIHTAEGQLFRDAIGRASEALAIPVTEVGAKELEPRAAKALRLSDAGLTAHVARIGGAAGRPWSKDHRQACLAAELRAQWSVQFGAGPRVQIVK